MLVSLILFLSFSFSHIHILSCSLSHWLSFLVSLMLPRGCSIFLISHLLTYSHFSLSHHSPFHPRETFKACLHLALGKKGISQKSQVPIPGLWCLPVYLTCIFSGYFRIQPIGPKWTRLRNSSSFILAALCYLSCCSLFFFVTWNNTASKRPLLLQ